MAFWIAARIAAATVLIDLDIQDDLGAGSLRVVVVSVDVLHDEVTALRLGTTDLIGQVNRKVSNTFFV